VTCAPPRLPEAIGSDPAELCWRWRIFIGWACTILLAATVWLVPDDLSRDGRITLIVLMLALIGWSVTRVGDTLIGLAAALALAAAGVLSTEKMFGALGHDLIWLLVAAFIISAVLRASGLLERLVFAVLHRLVTVRRLFLGLTGVIAATAFVIPSTSGRAALLLPVFVAVAERIDSERIVRALALLFPTIILLSAAGSLIGAGAHIVAADFIERTTSERIDYLGWLVMALPFALVSSALAVLTILRLFLTSEEASRHIHIASVRRERLTRQELAIASIVLVTVGLWMALPLHGLSVALIALIGALSLQLPGVTPLAPREAFKAVNVELIVFLAATFAIAEALSQSGADRWLAQGIVQMLPISVGRSTPFIVALVALVSLLAHLVIASRTARATVLIPALALPLAGLGHDPKLLILVTVMGTGFCQTLAASAKPVALFAHTERPTYAPGDLLRLSAVLLPMLFALLMLFALAVWS
jgi:sodium-dependent dicarboxylate transporter 2/3/5